MQIYKGPAAFIALPLAGLAIAGAFPGLVNYLPNKTHLISETAPPPSNPKLQECLEDYQFVVYANTRRDIEASIERVKTANLSYLPDEYQERLNESYRQAGATFAMIEEINAAEKAFEDYLPGYRPLHVEVRKIQRDIRKIRREIDDLEQERQRATFAETVDEERIEKIRVETAGLEAESKALEASIPGNWKDVRAEFEALAKAVSRSRQSYRQNVDDSYATIVTMRQMISETDRLEDLQSEFDPLLETIRDQSPEEGLEAIKALELEVDKLTETHRIKSKLSRAKRALRGTTPDKDKAMGQVTLAAEILQSEVAWHQRAANELADDLDEYDQAIAGTIGMRMQERLTSEQAESIASCRAVHKDISLHF